MYDDENLGGCPVKDNVCVTTRVSPIQTTSTSGIKKVSFTECPVCGRSLVFGSRDPLEGDYYHCEACECGPICFPLYEGPKKKIAPVVDAEELQRALKVIKSIKEEPVPGLAESPHPYLDKLMTDKKLETAFERVSLDTRLANANQEEL